ncbi:MAG TPA: M36 family metallopeptidase, partial [Verrucomicrobiae bacterium]
MLAPPNPTFLQARNAILQADLNFGGADMDLLWAAFAKRGMGLSATSPANFTTTGVGEAFNTPLDTNAPVIVITSPADNSLLNGLTSLSGTAYDGGSGLSGNQIHLTLSHNGNYWSGTYWTNTSANDPTVRLTANVVNGAWNFTSLPIGGNLSQGIYSVNAVAQDNAGNSSVAQAGVTAISFNVDTIPPNVAFYPLTNNATIFDLAQLGGTLSEAGTTVVRIEQYDTAGTNYGYWNGAEWIADGNDPAVYLPTTTAAGIWTPASGINLPGRAQLQYGRYGHYFLRAIGADLAGNLSTNEILVHRTAPDTTPPLVTLDNLHNGDIITNQALPAFTGSALDYETGIAAVNVYLYRFTTNGIFYWNGSAWSPSPAALSTSYNAQTVAWQLNAALPAGANLPNGSYQTQIAAQNQEAPNGSTLLTVSFSVDYHPVYVFTYGSQAWPNPDLNWSDPLNWNQGSVPTPDAIVVINGYNVNGNGAGNLALYQLDLTGSLTTTVMAVQKLNLNGDLTGTITVVSNANWSGGSLNGTFTLPAGAVMNITNNAVKTLGSGMVFNNAGNLNWTGPGAIFCDGRGNYGLSPATINNLPGGKIQLMSDGTLFTRNGTASELNNFAGATLRKAGGTNTTYFNAFTLNNTGDVRSDVGILLFNETANAPINFNNGSQFYSGGGLIQWAADVRLAGTNYSECPIQLTGGFLTGTTNTPTYTGPGLLTWLAGSLNGNLSFASNSTVQINGANTKSLGSATVITNRGEFDWSGTGLIYCDGRSNYGLSPATFN